MLLEDRKKYARRWSTSLGHELVPMILLPILEHFRQVQQQDTLLGAVLE